MLISMTPPSVGFYSNLEQPWIGAILYVVGANTQKEFDSKVLMTLAPGIN
jgi:hypothetical protein